MQLRRGPFEVRLDAEALAKPEMTMERQFLVDGANAVDTEAIDLQFRASVTSHGKVTRDFDCNNYETCLGLAAALNWDSFTCNCCDRKINPQLIWRAHQNIRQDKSLNQICDLPEIKRLISKE